MVGKRKRMTVRSLRPRRGALARTTAEMLAARLDAAATLSRLADALATDKLDGPPDVRDDLVGGAAALLETDDRREPND